MHTDLNLSQLQSLLDATLLEETALDAELERLLAKRTVRAAACSLCICSSGLQELAETLSGLEASGEVLEVVLADAQHVSASVAGTCVLAERVSGKVSCPLRLCSRAF